MKNKIIIIGMIYKSVQYLDFMMYGIKKYCIGNNIDYLIIANDATDLVLKKLKNDKINHIIYNDIYPDDYYLNRVYRAWNFGGFSCNGDIIIFINSDMAFTYNWINPLIENLNENTIPCSRLIESGKLLSGTHAIGNMNFGTHPLNYHENNFLFFAEHVKENIIKPGGLFMPCVFYKKDFVSSGGYPEGNVYEGGPGKINTPLIITGDNYLFYKNEVMSKKQHITVFNSLIYHIQEGEKDA